MRIDIEQLRKDFGGVPALAGIDVSIPSGTLAVLVGPSGSGKSTLLNLIAGLVHPSGGKISFDGRDVTRQPPEKRSIGYVFQSYALFPHLDVAGNVGFGIEGRSRREKDLEVSRLLEQFGLDALARRLPRELSGGERQRTAVARAMARAPELLLLDEPLSALDAQTRERLRYDLATSLRDYARTAIHVTHDRQEAMALADLLIVMRAGRVEQSGTPFDLYRSPANLFVAEFLGDATLVPVDTADQSLHTRWARFRASTPVREKHFLMVRPEQFVVAPGRGEIRAHVRTTTFLGSHWRVEAVDQHGVALKADIPGDLRPQHGEVLELSLDVTIGHFVGDDSSFSGERLYDDRSFARG